jgi:hypothetical protein
MRARWKVNTPVRRLRADEADRAAANLKGGRRDFTWIRELTGTPNGDAPVDLNTSCTYAAEVEIPPFRPTIYYTGKPLALQEMGSRKAPATRQYIIACISAIPPD